MIRSHNFSLFNDTIHDECFECFILTFFDYYMIKTIFSLNFERKIPQSVFSSQFSRFKFELCIMVLQYIKKRGKNIQIQIIKLKNSLHFGIKHMKTGIQ